MKQVLRGQEARWFRGECVWAPQQLEAELQDGVHVLLQADISLLQPLRWAPPGGWPGLGLLVLRAQAVRKRVRGRGTRQGDLSADFPPPAFITLTKWHVASGPPIAHGQGGE